MKTDGGHRGQILLQVDDLLSTTDESVDDAVTATCELIATVIGEQCTVLRLGSDGTTFDRLWVAHRRGDRMDGGSDSAGSDAEAIDALPGFIREALLSGHLVSGSGAERTRAAPHALDWERHVAAPIRCHGLVLGIVATIRPSTQPKFDAVETHLVQVLADRLGAIMDADRVSGLIAAETESRRVLDDRLKSALTDQSDLVLQLDRTESRERARLAEALHDDPLQLVVAAMLRIESMNTSLSPADARTLADAVSSLETAVEQIRSLIVTLTPPDLSAGLGAALRTVATATFLGSTTQISVSGPDHVQLDPRTKMSVYRIAREALTNARKHASATHVVVELTETADLIRIRVTDDGIGVDAAKTGPGHLGVASMRARAAAAHAELVISSVSTGGTCVEISVPTHSIGPAGSRASRPSDNSPYPPARPLS